QQGLTLVELLVALAVGAVVLVIVQGVFLNAGTMREKSREESTYYLSSRVFYDRLAREVGSALYRKGHPYAHFRLEDGAEKSLEFATFASSPGVGGRDRGAAMITYLWRVAEDGEGYELLRRERPLQERDERGEEQLLANELDAIELLCFADGSWQKEWDSDASQQLPQLLKVGFEVGSGEQKTPFRTVMEISSGSGG
ncbi:MAG: hypothetical protein C0624_02090, partial [Desulfuromonas sp.]